MTAPVELVWITPNAKQMVTDIARVSSPANIGTDGSKLLRYLVRNGHWSPWEMTSACVSIRTTRDIGRQILRHRSFHFQEFSQRYAAVTDFHSPKHVRMQDSKNRQNSIASDDPALQEWWADQQATILQMAENAYLDALDQGIAKEVARVILPEGLTMSHMYMAGTLRDWIHYVRLRQGNGTQLEHKQIALEAKAILNEAFEGFAELVDA